MKRALLLLAACGPAAPAPEAPRTVIPDAAVAHLVPDPEPEHPTRLVDVDWDHTTVTSDAEALALWKKIAPTGDDWEQRIGEIPTDKPVAHALAVALIKAGNFACHPAPAHTRNCTGLAPDLPPLDPAATLDDPCLRRMVALWAFDQLEPADTPALLDSLRSIAALPPPESQLVAAAIHQVPETDLDERLRMIVLAHKAGQRELVDGLVGMLDEPHLILAAAQEHIPGALVVLSAEGHRKTYLGAIADEQLPPESRLQAIADIVGSPDPLGADGKAALVAATSSPSCAVAARAARALDGAGDHRFVPAHPHAKTSQQMVRALCLLASYELTQQADETSLWPNYLTARGLERVTVTYDALSEVDTDGDGDPHTTRSFDIEKRRDAQLPEVDDLVRAMPRCTIDKDSAACTGDSHTFRFGFKRENGELVVGSLEVAEQPPCVDK